MRPFSGAVDQSRDGQDHLGSLFSRKPADEQAGGDVEASIPVMAMAHQRNRGRVRRRLRTQSQTLEDGRRSGATPEHWPRLRYRALAITTRGCTVDSLNAEHIVVREPTEVMLVRVADELSEIQRAWASFEAAVGLRGRKFYGAFDPVTDSYSVCAVLRPGDDPSDFVRSVGRFPAGATHVSVSTASLQASTRRSGRLRSALRSGLTPITHARPWSTTAVTISSMSSCRSSEQTPPSELRSRV